MKTSILEFQQTQTANQMSEIEKSMNLIKQLILHLKPRNERETQALKLIGENLNVIRSGIKNVINSFNNIQPQDLTSPQDNSVPTNEPNIKNEMSSAAAGAVMGTAGKKKKLLDEEDLVKEARNHLRKLIKNSIKSLYNENPLFLTEAEDFLAQEQPTATPQKTTGEAILNETFGELREKIEKTLDSLQTDKSQRDSYKEHLTKMFEGSLNELGKNTPVSNIPGDTQQKKGINVNSPEFEQKYKIPNLEETGFNQAKITFNATWTKIEEAAKGLANPQDRQIFIQGIVQNIPAVCDLKEKNLSDKMQQNQPAQPVTQDTATNMPSQAPNNPSAKPGEAPLQSNSAPQPSNPEEMNQNDSLKSLLSKK